MGRESLRAKMKVATLQEKIDIGSPALSVFRFALPDEFLFEPGQYATLALDTPTGFLPRPYSIASSPYQMRALEFYINEVSDGEFTPSLFRLKPGESAWYMGPKGKFTLSQTKRKNLFLISTGTGLAPFISMLRKLDSDATDGKWDYNVVVLHGASYSSDLGYRGELQEFSRRPDRHIFYIPTVSRPEKDPAYQPVLGQGRVNDLFRLFLNEPKAGTVDPRPPEGLATETISNLINDGAAFYLCGNPGMIADLKDVLLKRGHTEIFTEDYW
ncbi:MAG TPA: FAD-binding oxidoreductase [Acidobacteriota bacterium]|jgi:ferredoxin--NADP+ reductase